MKAFILAGGLGTRLRPRFGDLPKTLVPVAGRAFSVRQLEWLARHGLTQVVLCVGYGADRIQEALGDGSAYGVELEYSIETEPLGTGGALAHAAARVRGATVVVNGDTLAECDPWALERARWERGAIGALALYEVQETQSRGRVELNGTGSITRFVEKDAGHRGSGWVNGGVYAFGGSLWRELPRGASSLERDVLPSLAAAGRLLGERYAGDFYDIGTPEEWERAERDLSP